MSTDKVSRLVAAGMCIHTALFIVRQHYGRAPWAADVVHKLERILETLQYAEYDEEDKNGR